MYLTVVLISLSSFHFSSFIAILILASCLLWIIIKLFWIILCLISNNYQNRPLLHRRGRSLNTVTFMPTTERCTSVYLTITRFCVVVAVERLTSASHALANIPSLHNPRGITLAGNRNDIEVVWSWFKSDKRASRRSRCKSIVAD